MGTKILCRLFGHKVPKHGYYLNAPYFRRGHSRVTDGIGRIHQSLSANCVRCEKPFDFGYIHDYKREDDL